MDARQECAAIIREHEGRTLAQVQSRQRWGALDCEVVLGTTCGRRQARQRTGSLWDVWAHADWLFGMRGLTDPEELAECLLPGTAWGA
eukprot:2265320-Rhodomonas_salina.1